MADSRGRLLAQVHAGENSRARSTHWPCCQGSFHAPWTDAIIQLNQWFLGHTTELPKSPAQTVQRKISAL